ncbi:V-type ATPase subunit a family protein [Pedomonas mirosovicensis]|uniref:V-type ATPase subunit a family protein n=1 Tax=Pedomonas mirosovicensis TaxID=2908641 RepID=UPI002166D6CF|nr:V-type ATPase subunit a family protein [Pedomonas mirosovicensis]MCH8685364.1 V-type ATPase subunit a family protein [Pedomonas mirosovicensis]
MTLQSATERLDAAVQLLESRVENRVRALQSENAALRLERDTLLAQFQELQAAAGPDLEAANALLQAEIEAMATAHDALLQRYNELQQQHAVLEQAANEALARVDRLIVALDTESPES